MADDARHPRWRRSSACSPPGNCVEVARAPGATVLRDTKGGAELPALDEARWRAFLDFCRRSG